MAKKDPLKEHRRLNGKLEVTSRAKLRDKTDLSVWYTPGVGEVAAYLGSHPEKAREYTIKKNSVAVVSDGSAVLGLGNIGPYAALPVMEGKCAIFKAFAGIDAYPIVLNTQDVEEIVATVQNIAPAFGGINLEDISAPHCFEVERRLKEVLNIPVFHDDQHGTAIVVLAGLLNAFKVVRKRISQAKIVVLGAGAAGTAISKLLADFGVQKIRTVDSKGVVAEERGDLNDAKRELARITKSQKFKSFDETIRGADALICVAQAGIVNDSHIRNMAKNPIVFALSNPVPEIDPTAAKAAGAAVVATGRSDYPNQINNALVFPGIFRGALDRGVNQITDTMKLRAARKLASLVRRPTREKIIPSLFEKGVARAIASSVK